MPARYLITYAQNAAPVHKGFLAALRRCAAVYEAELIAVAGTYGHLSTHWWADELQPYLLSGRRQLCPNLVVHGNIRIRPTTSNPLAGFEAYSGTASSIFGHPRIEYRTVPRAGSVPRIHTTTGAVTMPRYEAGAAGQKALPHHTFGACLVEVDGDRYHIRQINANSTNGAFYDLELRFEADGVSLAGQPAALVLGDWHEGKQSPGSVYDHYRMLLELKPQVAVLHDVLDFSSRGHHEIGRWWDRKRHRRTPENEVRAACTELAGLAQMLPVAVVRSNHHDHLDRWLQAFHPDDPESIPFWVESWHDYYQGDHRPAFQRWFDKFYPSTKHPVTWPEAGNFRLHGIELGYHGDRGPNGTRGSAQAFSKLGNKVVVGHNHSPSIVGSSYTVGVSAPPENFGYAKGAPSGWLDTHCLVYPNGKRTLLTLIDGCYRAKL